MIYPISESVDRYFASIVDEETGEVTKTDEEIQQDLEALNIEFDQQVLELRNKVINLTAEVNALRAEKSRLDKRVKVDDNELDRCKRFLAYLLKGEKYKNGAVSISYRKSDKLVIDDREMLMNWAKTEGRGFLKEPELIEGDIKKALKLGTIIPACHIEEKNNIQVR